MPRNYLKTNLKTSYIPLMLFSFIGLFMLLDVGFVMLASKSYPGPFTDNAYQKGVDFDKINRLSVYKEDTAWQIDYLNTAGELQITARDAKNELISKARVLVKIARPVTNKYDEVLQLIEVAPGVYKAPYEFKQKGQWDVRIKVIHDNQEFVKTERVIFN